MPQLNKRTCALILTAAIALAAHSVHAVVITTILEDFEGGGTHSAAAVTTANSAAASDSNSAVANVTDAGSKRLQLTDSDAGTNGCVITFTNAIPAAGNYIVTADIKVDNSSAAVASFGMAAVLGNASTAKVSDTHAGYVMNLTGSGDGSLGYQSVGAAVNATAGPFPQNLTLYFSTNPSGNSYSAPSSDGTFRYKHRTSTSTWAAGSTNAVTIDNIKITGPGNFGEDTHFWISAGNSYCNLSIVQRDLDIAKNNHFNCIDILARYRSDAYYVPNRDFNTYTNPEPYGTLVTGGTPGPTNDPLQYEIDHCHEMGMKAYISFSCFLATGGSTYPSYLPTGSVTWIYNSGSPQAQTGSSLWADVGRADVRTYMINVMCDIVQNYDIDGVIFDRIRYEGNTYGYNPVALSEMGISGTPAPADANFVDKRRDAVTTFLHDAYEAATDIKPWMVVGTVPIIYSTSFNDTYNSVMQFYPKWSARKTRNRILSFGAEDCIQPQCYRSGALGSYNSVYLDLARYGDVATYSLDYGFMNGANVLHCPLFYHPSSADSAQSTLNAQNICDAREQECSGSGLYAADTVRADIHMIRTASTSPCGVDSLANMPPNADYLMKAGYDNTAPNAVTGLTATPTGGNGVTLNWTAPVPAADGESASRYLIYRGTSAGVKPYYATQRNKATTVTATTYSDTTPASGSFHYSVVPVDDYNNRGPATEVGPVSVTGTAASSTPSAPSNPRVTAFGNVVYITWDDNSGIERSFQLQRDSVTIATLSENVCTYTDNDVAAGSHIYRVQATNSFGSSAYATATAVTAANTVATPTGLSGTGGAGLANLSWTDASTNESGFEILRSTVSGGPYSQVVTISPGSTSYTDTPVSAGTWYYVLRAFNGSASSLYSNQLTVTVTAPAPPAAPTGLSAAANISSIALTWTDNSSDETGFEVRRGTAAGGPYTLIATTGVNQATYLDSPPAAGTYYYVVRAVNSSGSSADTNEANASVSAPSTAPSALAAAVSGSNVTLTWTDTTSNESGFEVRRSATPGGPYSTVATTAANATTYVDAVAASGTYYYVVRAINGLGAGPDSNEANATVLVVAGLIIESRLPDGSVTPAPAYQENGTTWAVTTAKSVASGVTGQGGRWTGTGSQGAYAIFTPTIVTAGDYNVYVTLPNATKGPNNASPGAGFLVVHNGPDISGTLDLSRTNTALTDKWYLLASKVRFAVGTAGSVRITNNNPASADSGQRFDMDAVKFEFDGLPVTLSVWQPE